MLYYKSDKRPNELPANPARTYKKEWINWGDWLQNKPRKFWSFKEARKFARSLGFKNESRWRVYCKSGKRPDYIPAGPERVYKEEWNSMGDWLGTEYVAPQKRQYRPFKEARKFAQSLNLKNRDEWNVFCKSSKRPDDIPMNPYNAYKKEFQGMGDFLGTGNVATKEFWPFEKAREYVQNLGLKNNDEWVVFRKSSRRPDYIPAAPQRVYKEEFVSVGDWLGSGSIGGQEKAANYLPMREALPIFRRLAKQYGLNGRADWNRFAKTHQKLLDELRIPLSPWRSYSRERVRGRNK